MSVSPTEIQVQFNFTNPLEVKPSDTIFISLNFGDFESGLPEKQTIQIPCRKQVFHGTVTDTVNAVGQAS